MPVACFIANGEIFRFPAFDGMGKDNIGVIVVEEEDVVVSQEGLEGKLAVEVSSNQSFELGAKDFQWNSNSRDNVALL